MNLKSKSLLAVVLAISIAATGCSAQWINIALQDLPVLTQMALSIATLVSTLASGKQANPGDVAVIQNISAQASRDLNLLQSLYAEYKANANGTHAAENPKCHFCYESEPSGAASVRTHFKCG